MQCPVKFDSYDSLSLSLPSTFQVCFQFVTFFDHPSQIINKICTLQVTFEVRYMKGIVYRGLLCVWRVSFIVYLKIVA